RNAAAVCDLPDVEVELVHLVAAPDHLVADCRVGVGKCRSAFSKSSCAWAPVRWTSPSKGAQLLMKAPPDLAHQPNLPVLSASVSGLSWLQSEAPPNAAHTSGNHPGALPRAEVLKEPVAGRAAGGVERLDVGVEVGV